MSDTSSESTSTRDRVLRQPLIGPLLQWYLVWRDTRQARLIAYLFVLGFTTFGFYLSGEAVETAKDEADRRIVQAEEEATARSIEGCNARNDGILNLVNLVTFLATSNPRSAVDLDSAPGFDAMPPEVQEYFTSLENYLNQPNPDRRSLEELVSEFVEENQLVRDCDAIFRGNGEANG